MGYEFYNMSEKGVRTLHEFIDSNLDKRYPLVDNPEYPVSDLPSSFMADMKLCIGKMDETGEASYKYNTYVSSIHVHPDYVYIYISCSTIGESGTIAVSDPIPTSLCLSNSVDERTFHIYPTSHIPVNGTLVIGTCDDIRKLHGIRSYSKDQTMIFPANIIVMPTAITGIRVGNTTLTGDVTIQAGDNITIQCDEDTNTITISAAYSDNPIIDDAAFLAMVTAKYGKPITSINSVTPDEEGNIEISAADCLSVEAYQATSTICFFNPCGNTCASEEFMANTYDRIQDLNRGLSILSSLYNSASNVLAQMGVRVSAVLESRGDSNATNAESDE